MLAEERLQKELEQINTYGTAETMQLSKALGVTDMTIRRDLEALEKKGLIQRVHGGAKSLAMDRTVSMAQEKDMRARKEHAEEKDLVAKYAAASVEDGDEIYIDGGTSTAAMAPYLKNKKIRIVTNSPLAAEMLQGEKHEIYLLGGKLIEKYEMTAGPLVLENLQHFHFNKAFLSCLGVDPLKRIVYTAEMETAEVKAAVIKISDVSWLLADSSKLHIRGFCHFISTDSFAKVVLDQASGKLPENFTVLSK